MFKLALQLGKTVGELESELDYQELLEWQAYDRLDPFGGFRQDIQTAHLLYAKFGGDDHGLMDFLPIDPNPMTDEMRAEYEQLKQERELEQQSQALIQMFASLAN